MCAETNIPLTPEKRGGKRRGKWASDRKDLPTTWREFGHRECPGRRRILLVFGRAARLLLRGLHLRVAHGTE
jgi:hypothetical protein